MSTLNAARFAVLVALTLNVIRGLGIPLPPESAHEWWALTTSIILGAVEAAAFFALASRRRAAAIFVYSLGGLGLIAAVTHVPMLIHLLREDEPLGFFVMAVIEAAALAVAAVLKWRHEHGTPPLRAA